MNLLYFLVCTHCNFLSYTQRTLRVLLTFRCSIFKVLCAFFGVFRSLSRPPHLSSARAIIHHFLRLVNTFLKIFQKIFNTQQLPLNRLYMLRVLRVSLLYRTICRLSIGFFKKFFLTILPYIYIIETTTTETPEKL